MRRTGLFSRTGFIVAQYPGRKNAGPLMQGISRWLGRSSRGHGSGRLATETVEGDHMMTTRKCMMILVGFVLSTVAGCGTKYVFMGVTYTDPQKWLAVQRTYYDGHIEKIPALPKPLAKRALVILPGHGLIMEITQEQVYSNTLKRYGLDRETLKKMNPRNLQVRVKEEGWQSSDIFWDCVANSVKKRALFEEVQVQRSDKPENLPGGDYDAILYISSNLQQWLMKMKSRTESVPVFLDKSKTDPVEQRLSWLGYIEKTLAKEQAGRK
jgi:hypothetical protein